MKKLKYFSYVLLLMALCLPMVSCSDDDEDEELGIQDYFVELDLSGGGFTAQQLVELESEMNSELASESWNALTKDEALYLFNMIVDEFKSEFSGGVSGLKGTLKMTLYLKTTKGKTVKKATLNITEKGCSVS